MCQGKLSFLSLLRLAIAAAINVAAKATGRGVQVGNSGIEGEGVKVGEVEVIGVCVGDGVGVGVGVGVGDGVIVGIAVGVRVGVRVGVSVGLGVGVGPAVSIAPGIVGSVEGCDVAIGVSLGLEVAGAPESDSTETVPSSPLTTKISFMAES